MSRKNTNWTMPQLKRLKERYPVASPEELLAEFAPHTINAIGKMASELKITVPRRDWMAIAQAHVPVLTFGIARRG